MSEIFGNFIEMPETQEYLILSFSSSSLSIEELWNNNSMSADFLANYWGTFFPAGGSDSHRKRSEVRDAVSFISNELLENAVKFSYKSEISIKIGLYLSENELRFYVTNSVNPENVKIFKEYIKKLLTENPNDLYMKQLEMNVENNSTSCLGFLTILNNYNAKLAWKFKIIHNEPKIITITTLVRLPIVRS